jgi:hypothetical protein
MKYCQVPLNLHWRSENLADSGWIVVVGTVVGGGLTGAIALLQARSQQRFETKKVKEDRGWAEHVSGEERQHKETAERHAALMQIYTRYQLAVDRLENAIRELAKSRHPEISDDRVSAKNSTKSGEDFLEAFEAAQREYDEVCEILKLTAPLKTVEVALQQRQLYNRFAREALDGYYNHDASYELIVQAAQPVLAAMRLDLRSPE